MRFFLQLGAFTKSRELDQRRQEHSARNKVGKMEIEAKLFVYTMLGLTSIYFNIEAWTNLRQGDMDKMEVIQGKVLKGLLGLPKSTPYWGLLYELQILPIRLLIIYKKLMLYHNIMNSDEERFVKHLVKQQEIRNVRECWFGNLK